MPLAAHEPNTDCKDLRWREGLPPDNGLELVYDSATFGRWMLGHDEPSRVEQGERVLLRLFNASAMMDVSLALASPQTPFLTMARPFAAPPGVPAERVAALRSVFDAAHRDPNFLAEGQKLGVESARLPPPQ